MKTGLHKLILLSFITIISSCNGYAQEWEKTVQNDLIRYAVHGKTVYGHQFGILKKAGGCERSSLWVTWSSFYPLKELKDQGFSFIGISLDGERLMTENNGERGELYHFVKTYPSQLVGKLNVVALIHQNLSDEFLQGLLKASEVRVEVPKDLSEFTVDDFNILGINQVLTEMTNECEKL